MKEGTPVKCISTIPVCVGPEIKAKAAFLAKKEGRTLLGYIRRLVKRDIRADEAGGGPMAENGRVPGGTRPFHLLLFDGGGAARTELGVVGVLPHAGVEFPAAHALGGIQGNHVHGDGLLGVGAQFYGGDNEEIR